MGLNMLSPCRIISPLVVLRGLRYYRFYSVHVMFSPNIPTGHSSVKHLVASKNPGLQIGLVKSDSNLCYDLVNVFTN